MDNHINSWIERAHSYPLSLVIRNQQGDFSDPVCSVLTLITQHQWKSITLNSGDASILSILKKLEFLDLEMLESFSLAPRFYSKFSPPNALRYAPKLRTLSLFIIYPVALATLPFPWSQLTSLTITLYNTGVDILRACVNLEELIFTDEGSPSRLFRSNNPITLNYLRKLHLHTHFVGSTFLLSLETPSIQDFAVNIVKESGQMIHFPYDNGIYAYIKKHSSTLLKLSIDPSETCR
jgi:hypothetical protein